TWRVPLVVMIDGDSASASEIFAAAIQDSGRGKIVGARSYGKGSVQGIFSLGTDGAGARLTTARFFSPLGHPISNVGVTPDIDTRRATQVATGAEPAAANPTHTVAFRGAGGDGSASLVNSEAPNAPGAAQSGTPGSLPTATPTEVRFAPRAQQDPALDIAVEVVRTQPVAKL
ncbi:MAG TPA: S41 family peptidase, partial [Lacipirellulaceae bacterium]|nr:S41 family peptidase [Lacipirellulaceae bacterium]